MPDWVYAVILGVVEGLTEFIPVSSTGHLLLTKTLLGLPGAFWDTFSVLIQLGAILAVVVLYFARLWKVAVRIPFDPAARHFVISVLAAFLPTMALGFLLHDVIKDVLFESPALICWSLIIGGVVLLTLDRWAPAPRDHDAMALPLWKSFLIGVLQCFSMIPGVSRSGATIVGGIVLGLGKRAATEFSFFLAIPTMVGAFAYDLYENRDLINVDQAGLIAVGFAVSFISGVIVVKLMLDFINRFGLAPFGWWRILVGAGGLAALALT